MPVNGIGLLIMLVLGAVSFAAGWRVSGWRKDAEQKEVLVQEVIDYQAKLNEMSGELRGVITKASEATEAVNDKLDEMNAAVGERNVGLDMLAKKTRELGDEISKLGPANCVLTPPYRRLYYQIGDEANSGRDRLYIAPGSTSH